jgi:hypothetical protein
VTPICIDPWPPCKNVNYLLLLQRLWLLVLYPHRGTPSRGHPRLHLVRDPGDDSMNLHFGRKVFGQYLIQEFRTNLFQTKVNP